MAEFGSLIVAGLLSGSVIAAVLGVLLKGRETRMEETVKHQFREAFEVFRSQWEWKEASLSRLLGPVYLQLDRTERAFRRWRDQNLYLEMKVVRDGNDTIRRLLLENAHLIPPHLLEDGGRLVEHYDVWLEEFDRKRQGENPDLESKFVFVGPRGFPFPRESADRFQEAFESTWTELYGGG